MAINRHDDQVISLIDFSFWKRFSCLRNFGLYLRWSGRIGSSPQSGL